MTTGVRIKSELLKFNQLAKGQEVALNRVAAGHCPCLALQLYSPEGEKLLLVHQPSTPLTQFSFRAVFRWAICYSREVP